MDKNFTDKFRILHNKNIDEAIQAYKTLLKEIPLKIEAKDLLSLMKSLKRDKIGKGPYPDVSIFESANRIMTDLVILFGAKTILNGEIEELKEVSELLVEYGNENKNAHDIIGKTNNGNVLFVGEAFNVATSYFAPKKSSTTKKFKESKTPADFQIIFCNDDSKKEFKEFKLVKNEINILPVTISL